MIGFSLWGLLVMQGIYDGMMTQMINNHIKTSSGDFSITQKGFRENRDINLNIEDYEKIIKNLKQQNQNIKTTKKVISDALLSTAKKSTSSELQGIELKENESLLKNYIIKGKYELGKSGAIIGYKLFEDMGLKLGDKVILSFQDSKNEITALKVKIKGVIKTNNLNIDQRVIFIDMKKAQKALGIKGVSQISIFSNKEVKIENKSLEILNWSEVFPALKQSKDMMKQFSFVSYFLIFLIASMGIFGVVLISVMERIREFAVLEAIGSSFWFVSFIVVLESSFIAILGYLLGVFLGGGTLSYLHIYGLDLSRWSDALSEFGMDAVTYALIKFEYFSLAFWAVFISIVFSVIIPLYKLKKIEIIKAINGQ